MKKPKIKKIKRLTRNLHNPVMSYAVTGIGLVISYKIAAKLTARFPQIRSLLEDVHDEIIDQVQHSKERIMEA